MPSTTRQTIREEVLDRYHTGERWRRGTTSGTGSTSTVVDTSVGFSAALPNRFFGAYIKLTSGSADEEVSQITQFEGATGTFTVDPVFSASSGNAVTYEIWYDTHPEEVDNAIDRILTAFPNVAYLPVTALTDGDMEDSGVSEWTNAGMATLEKSTSIHPFGRQALHALADATSDAFINGTRAFFEDDEIVYMYLPIYITTGGAVLTVALLQGAGRAIGTLTNARNQAVLIRLEGVSVTSNTGVTPSVTVTTGATSDFYTGFVAMYGSKRRQYILDSASIEFAEDVLRVFRLREGDEHAAITDTGSNGSVRGWLWDDSRWDEVTGWTAMEAKRGIEPRKIQFDRPITDLHMMEVRQRHTALTSDSGTTFADKNTVVNGVLHYLELARGDERKAREYLRTYNHLLDLQGFGPQIDDESDRQSVRFR